MLTTVANALFDHLIESFAPNRPYSREELESDELPAPVAAYLVQMLEVRLQDAIASDPPENAWVDVYAREVKEARARYLEALERHQAVPATEWADALRTACHDALRYLVRPASTLTDTVYGSGATSVKAGDVFRRIGYYEAYPYFRNVIEAYFDQKDASRIERDRFDGLVHRTDRQMTADFTPKQWRKLLEPLATVLRAAGRRELPVELVKAFLQEKEADAPLRRLKLRYGLDGIVPFDELEDLFQPEPQPEPEPVGRRDDRPTEERPATDRHSDRRDGPVPLWKQFESGYEPAPKGRNEERVPRSNDAPEPLWKQFRKSPDPPRAAGTASLADLERSVLGDRGARNRDLFVRHLFSGRRDDYETTLRRLAGAGSWSQASQIIAQEVFLRHQVNIYSDPAVAFTDAAEAQYRS